MSSKAEGTTTTIRIHVPHAEAIRRNSPTWGTIDIPARHVLDQLTEEERAELASLGGPTITSPTPSPGVVVQAVRERLTKEAVERDRLAEQARLERERAVAYLAVVRECVESIDPLAGLVELDIAATNRPYLGAQNEEVYQATNTARKELARLASWRLVQEIDADSPHVLRYGVDNAQVSVVVGEPGRSIDRTRFAESGRKVMVPSTPEMTGAFDRQQKRRDARRLEEAAASKAKIRALVAAVMDDDTAVERYDAGVMPIDEIDAAVAAKIKDAVKTTFAVSETHDDYTAHGTAHVDDDGTTVTAEQWRQRRRAEARIGEAAQAIANALVADVEIEISVGPCRHFRPALADEKRDRDGDACDALESVCVQVTCGHGLTVRESYVLA
jgi:hypothetical protein